MKYRILTPLLYFGLVFMIVGTVFKIQHWPFGIFIQCLGTLAEFLFFALVALEIFGSKKAGTDLKITCMLTYLILPIACYLYLPAIILVFAILILGAVYLKNLRKKFLYTRNDVVN